MTIRLFSCETLTALLATALLQAQDPMLTPMEEPQLQRIAQQEPGIPARVFTETREFPIRRINGLPARWVPQIESREASFRGQARPGEFYVFQIGVYALRDTGPLVMHFGDLQGEGRKIPAESLQCLSLGGLDYQGLPFNKEVRMSKGQLQALWIGITVPTTAKGTYAGLAYVRFSPESSAPVQITLNVEGTPVTDYGDSVAKNLSRLRWLNSAAGSEPTLTQPFTPIRTKHHTIQVLGRDLSLGENGLPARIISYFSSANTHILTSGRDVLAQPMAFVVQTREGDPKWRNSFGRLAHTEVEATWSAQSTADGLQIETRGRIDYTGSGEIRVRLRAERDLSLQDARLEVPFRESAASYFMGLHKQGGPRPSSLQWKWDVQKRQDCFWMGNINAGLMLRFKDQEYLRPPVNIYYGFRPLHLPTSWGNAGKGGIDLEAVSNQQVRTRAYSGPREMKRGETLDFVFEIYLTPFRPLDTEKQWAVRFTHLGGSKQRVDEAVAKADALSGPNVVNVHHASYYAPYINYPYSDDSFSAFRELVARAHAKGVKLRVYYTTREITQNMPELFALHSLNGEIILPGPGKDARTLIHSKGPHPWLKENLREGFIPAWETTISAPYTAMDLSVITTPDSRWNNFYLQGLQQLVTASDFDGVYVDDTALNATSLRRARRILDQRQGRIIDLHTWNHFNKSAGFANNLNIYMEILPYLDRLWIGEGFDASAVSPGFWLIEMSGLPFGLMGEMLDGANPWRGMVFGETARHSYSGDVRGLWKVWDDFGIQGTEYLPFFAKECPINTDHPDVLASVYRKNGRSFVALGSWAKEEVSVRLNIHWEALGLSPDRARIFAPAIAGMQPEKRWKPGDPIVVEPKKGWFLVMDETAVAGPQR